MPREIPSIHFAEAMALIGEATGEDLRGEMDLAPAHERWLGEWAQREHGSDFLFVVGYPMAKRPFYTHPDPERPGYSRGFDLLFRGLELVTGGQRLHRYDDYLAALARAGDRPGAVRRRTWRRSSTGCRRTAGSPSAWSGAWRGWPGWRMCGR